MAQRKKLDLTLTPLERLKKAEEAAIYQTALQLWRRGRKPEGTIDDNGTWSPSDRERMGKEIKHSPRSYKKWPHPYHLVQTAIRKPETDLPPDVVAFVKSVYPRVHERFMVGAVDENLKADSKRQELDKKQKRVASLEAHAKSVEGRLSARYRQLEGLDKKLKALDSKRKALLTRRGRVLRSINALNRSKKGTS